MQIINDTLIELMLGQATVFENLAVFPLLSGKQSPADYLTLGGKVAGVELFDNDTTLSKTLEKLVGSFALDALEAPAGKTDVPDEASVKAFLDQISKAEITQHRAVDLGTDIRLSGDGLVGGALIADWRIVHLSAFNLEEVENQYENERFIA